MPGAAFDVGRAISRVCNGQLPGRHVRIRLHGGARAPTSRIPHPCHWRCAECGFLVAQTGVSTYRGGDDIRPGPCPHCGETCWSDLREPAVVEALGEWEESLRHTRDARVRGWLTLSAALLALLVAVFAARPDGTLLVFGPLLGLVGIVAVRRGIASLALGRRPTTPVRWRIAPSPRGRVISREVIVASTPEPLLRAPVSGRPCLAYELAIREDRSAEGETWTWRLVEQRVSDLTVAGQILPGDQIVLDIPRVELTVASEEARRHALGMRGFDPAVPGAVIYETILVPGDSLGIEHHAGGGATVRRATASAHRAA